MSATTSSAQNELTDSWGVAKGIARVNTKGHAGTVHAHRARVGRCVKCGGIRLQLDGPHAPRLEVRNGEWLEVDCSGDEVQRAA